MSVAEVVLEPARVDLALYAGDAVTLTVVFDNMMGVRIPITGTVVAQVKQSRGDGSVLQNFAVDLSGAGSGVVVLSLSAGQTAALGGGSQFIGVWDVQNTPPGGAIRTLVQGACRVRSDVSD